MSPLHSGGFWIRAPWGTYCVAAGALLRDVVCLVLAGFLLVSAARFAVCSSTTRDSAIEVALKAPHAIFEEPEPLSKLFGLDAEATAPFVLVSTLLGPSPRATVTAGESTFTVAVGDTVRGALVDSIGRRVVIIRVDTEVMRVEL